MRMIREESLPSMETDFLHKRNFQSEYVSNHVHDKKVKIVDNIRSRLKDAQNL